MCILHRLLLTLPIVAASTISIHGDTPKTKPEAKEFSLLGAVVAPRRVAMVPRSGGSVAEILVREGDRVKKGQILVRLDDRVERAQLEAAQARLVFRKARLEEVRSGPRKEQLHQAESERDHAIAAHRIAKAALARLEEMLGRNETARPEFEKVRQQVEQAALRLRQTEIALDVLKETPRREHVDMATAELKEAEAMLHLAEIRLDETALRAPFDATITVLRNSVGSFVGPAGSVGEMVDLTSLEVEIEVSERDIRRLEIGQPCRLSCDAFPDRIIKGELIRVRPIVDPAKATVTGVVTFDSGKTPFLPGMRVRVDFLRK
jgi:HlyD family secretion protein